MQDFLLQIDLDYYRSALLLVARAELERLRQERSVGAGVERPVKMPPGVSPSADAEAVHVPLNAARS